MDKHLVFLGETKLKRLTFSEVFRFFLAQTCTHIFDQTGCQIRVNKTSNFVLKQSAALQWAVNLKKAK